MVANTLQDHIKCHKFSFPSFQGIITAKACPTLPKDYNPTPGVSIQPITDENFDQVIKYDQSVSLVNRSKELNVFFESQDTVATYCALQDGKVVGFIILRKGLTDMRSSAFYAKDISIATDLFYEVVKHHFSPETQLELGFSRANIDPCKAMYEKFGITEFAESDEGMYTKQDMPIKWDNVYAVLEMFSLLM